MSRYEGQEADPLDVNDYETNVERSGKNEDYREEIKTEDDERREREEANDNKTEPEPEPEPSFSGLHKDLEERYTPPPRNSDDIHVHNSTDAELEETKDKVETERDNQSATMAAGDQANPLQKVEEDGAKAGGEKTPTDKQSGGRKDEAKSEKAKRESWRQTKGQPEVKKQKEINGESHSAHGRSLAPAAPKKVANKLNSIIEDYTTRIRGSNSRPEAADKTPVRVGSVRGGESEPKGHISEIRAKIERSASSAQSRPPRRSFGSGGAKDAESIDEHNGVELETKRKKKAEEWLNKVVKPSDSGSHGPVDRSGPLSPPVKAQTSTWKKRELELKKEREEREAAQKQLEEKKKKLEEERRLAREAARKLKEQDDATKREQLRNQTTTATTPTTTTERKHISYHVTEKTSRSAQSPVARTSSLVKSLSVSSEDEKLKKQKAIESRLRPLNLDGLSKDELEKKAHELHERIRELEEDKYDLQILLEKRESELNELKIKTGDAKGKFVKPQLKKVIKKEEGMLTNKDDVSFSAKFKTEDDESKIKATNDEGLTNMTNTEEDGVGGQHLQPAVEQLQTAES